MPPANKQTLGERAVETGLKLYDRFTDRANLPVNKRVFLESVLDKRKDPITEKTFKPEELSALTNIILGKYESITPELSEYEKYLSDKLTEHAKAVKKKDKDAQMYPEFVKQYKKDLAAIRAYKTGKLTQDFLSLTSGKTNYEQNYALGNASKTKDLRKSFTVQPAIMYEDYGMPESYRWTTVSDNGVRSALQTTLGRFAYEIDPKTNSLVLKDTYDFNPPGNLFTGGTSPSRRITEGNVGLSVEGRPSTGLYSILRQYAGTVLPPGQGRDVRIQLNSLPPPIKNRLTQ